MGYFMHTKLNAEDCMYLISEERFQRFCTLIEELKYFTWRLPIVKDSYQRSATILDIWYVISTPKITTIENPENTMIYPYRYYLLSVLQEFSIKRYIQLALYENEKLSFVCAIYLYMGLDDFLMKRVEEDEVLVGHFKKFEEYSTKSFRPYYDLKYHEVENYPKELARLQSLIVYELKVICEKYKETIHLVLGEMISEAEKIYEAVFGLINDWGGRVS